MYSEESRYNDWWASYAYTYYNPSPGGTADCAFRCFLIDRCQFYYYHTNGYCYLGDFNSPGHSYLSSSEDENNNIFVIPDKVTGKYQ